MANKGNGLDLTNDYLRQLLVLTNKQNEKLDSVKQEVASVKQELVAIKEQQQEHSVILRNLAAYIAQDRARQDREVQDLRHRVEALERKPA